MQFTQDEKAALLKQFEPLLRGTVRRACACYNLNAHQVYSDLYQSAAEGFLRHLGSIKAAHHAGGCKKDLLRYVSEDVRRMHTVSIPFPGRISRPYVTRLSSFRWKRPSTSPTTPLRNYGYRIS